MVIVSRLPGRIRFRGDILKDGEAKEHLKKTLAQCIGTVSVTMDSRIGSLLVCYDSRPGVELAIVSKIDEVLASSAGRGPLFGKRLFSLDARRRAPTWGSNARNVVKYGTSLAFLLTALSGWYHLKKAHVVISSTLTLFVFAHVWGRKKQLWSNPQETAALPTGGRGVTSLTGPRAARVILDE